MALPSTLAFRELLESQLRREVALRPADPLSPTTPGTTFAIYVDEHLATRVVVVTDLSAAAYAGAAAGVVPVGVADAAVRDHALPALIADRFRGVLEGWADVLGTAPDERLRLYQALLPGTEPPADAVALAAARGMRLDLAVTVRAYGGGRVSIVLAR